MEARYSLVLAITCTIIAVLLPVAVGQEPTITITPNLTRPGGMVNILGQNLPSKQPYELRIDGNFFSSGNTLLNGTLNRDLVLPRTISLGNHTMNLTSAAIFAAKNFTIVQWEPDLSYSPSTVYPGMAIEILGTGYPPNAAYWIYLDGSKTLSGATDGSGSFTRAYQLSKDLALGSHNISANATQYFGPPTALVIMNVTQWPVVVDVEPGQTNPGRSITITGSQFPPSSLYRIELDGVQIINGQVDPQGSFQDTYQLSTTMTLGQHQVYALATDYSGQPGDNDTVQLVQWPVQLSVDPPRAKPGQAVNLQGLNFPPGTTFNVYLDDVQVGFGTTNSLGQIQVQYVLPKDLSTGDHQLRATTPSYSGPPTATAQVGIDPWIVDLEVLPLHPRPGEKVTINGSNYPPSSTCDVYIDSGRVATLKADSNGGFLLEWWTPRNISLGLHNVTAWAVNYAGPPVGVDSFQATQWPLSVSPNTTNIASGSFLQLNGTGFPPLAPVRIYWDGVNYIKAGTTSGDGNLSLDMFFNYPEDDAYHLLVVNVTDTYTGPPSTFTHIWLGQQPPNMTIETLDQGWNPRKSFYVDEGIYARGHGYPPLAQVQVMVLGSVPVTGAALDPVTTANIATDALGNIAPTLLWPSGGEGEYYLLADVNANSIMDGIDLLMDGQLVRRLRPDVAVTEVVIEDTTPVQGDTIRASFEVANEGGSELTANLTLTLDASVIWNGAVTGLSPGSTVVFNTSIETGQLALGSHNFTADAGAMDDEIDIIDNSFRATFTVLSRPDVMALLIMPNSTSLIVGEALEVSVIVKNLGERPESMRVDLLVDSVVVGTQEIQNIVPQNPYPFKFVWDTSSEQPRNFTLSARVEELPFESMTANNHITYGTLSLSLPNLPPVAEPGGPYSGTRGETIEFDGSASYDPDGEIASYAWDFGDGQTGQGKTAGHVYTSDGSYRVTLNVTDSDGEWRTKVTNCRVTTPTYKVNLSVTDVINGETIANADIKLDGLGYSLPEGFITLELEPGEYQLLASAGRYSPKTVDLVLSGSTSISIGMNPVCRTWASDNSGVEKAVFSTDEVPYAAIMSPGEYYSRLYVIPVAPPLDQAELLDATGRGPITVNLIDGVTYVPAWSQGLRVGEYRMALDLDADGVFDSSHDRISPRFSIPEGMAMIFACMFYLFAIGGNSPRRGAAAWMTPSYSSKKRS